MILYMVCLHYKHLRHVNAVCTTNNHHIKSINLDINNVILTQFSKMGDYLRLSYVKVEYIKYLLILVV